MMPPAQPRSILLLVALLVSGGPLLAVESPTSYGEASKVDTPILRIPQMQRPPTIDGRMAEGEWEDAASLSGFWYDFAQAKFYFLAPIETQLQVYGAYDKDNLYLAYSSPVYPENSWLRARGRFPDVTHHPQYGIIWDDHVELELRPYPDNAKGFQLGLFKWFINPINTAADLYWSVNGGERRAWPAKAVIRNGVSGARWIIEIAIPLTGMVYGNYEGTDEHGRPLVQLPPPDGTAYRCWFTRGIGGNSTFFNAFDNHVWNTTKTKLILDSQAPVFQINELGPIMEDMVDLRLTVKNHNTRSETVRIGFFVESEEGMIYSSYEAPELQDGLLELAPGAARKLRLRKSLPGISQDGNVLWFDVRSAGRPAKTLFRTRLIRFHSMDGGKVARGEGWWDFQDRRLKAIDMLRPPRREFEFSYEVSTRTNKLSGFVDIGSYGASEEAKRAEDAKLEVMLDDADETVVTEALAPFHGNFACFLVDLPEMRENQTYKVSLLLFDQNKRIVGERHAEPFTWATPDWLGNQLGRNDVVWEPFEPIAARPHGLTTLKHQISVDPSGLPAQIFIKPDRRELPLGARDDPAAVTPTVLAEIGRGPQLRQPFRFEIVHNGERQTAEVVEPATLTRQWQSEFEYRSKLSAGPLQLELISQYDCDGSLHCQLTYGSNRTATVETLELVADFDGLVDLAVSSLQGGGMASADVWQCYLPEREGIVWSSADVEPGELYYSHFVPWLWFGSGDRGFTWFADSDQYWLIDRDGSTMTLERDAAGAVTWRVKFINSPHQVSGARTVSFSLLTHPAKSKPADFRRIAWFGRGGAWADEYPGGDLTKTDAQLLHKARMMAQSVGGLGKDAGDEEIAKWTPDQIYWRYYQLRSVTNVPNLPREHAETFAAKYEQKWSAQRFGGEMDQFFADKMVHYFERHVRIGRRHGWWWDETWPVYRSTNVAEGNAYYRDPAEVGEQELPWQDCFLTGYMRQMFKRLARTFAENRMPLRNYLWANNSATCFESFAWDTMLVEECGAGHRTFEVDNLTVYPDSLYRYLSHSYTGLIARIAPDQIAENVPGGDPRLDRQTLGRGLLHDIGVLLTSPHGVFQQREQAMRLINVLHDFGYFDDQQLEAFPFWRNQQYIRFAPPARSDSILEQLAGQARVTVYRRPLDDGRQGFKALIVILNQTDHDVETPLEFRHAERLLGGPNTLRAATADVSELPASLRDWWQALAATRATATVLRDLESESLVGRIAGDAEAYGPVFVPRHDYRVLYAEHAAP